MIKPAHELQKEIHAQVKQEKFDSILNLQMESIKRCMSEFRTDCNFFFADSTQYRRDFEKQWKIEFYNKAVNLFESNGYKIVMCGSNTLITW
jgi:hypothetical protein